MFRTLEEAINRKRAHETDRRQAVAGNEMEQQQRLSTRLTGGELRVCGLRPNLQFSAMIADEIGLVHLSVIIANVNESLRTALASR